MQSAQSCRHIASGGGRSTPPPPPTFSRSRANIFLKFTDRKLNYDAPHTFWGAYEKLK